jgi:hypothetical protein
MTEEDHENFLGNMASGRGLNAGPPEFQTVIKLIRLE